MSGYEELNLASVKTLLDNTFANSMSIGLKLYKGITYSNELSDFYLFNSGETVRPSKTVREHGNYYNLLLNNLPKWEPFQKREKSIILTSCQETAKSFSSASCSDPSKKFGKTFRVLLPLGTHITIAPCPDIWNSFSKVLNAFSIGGYNKSLIDFNKYLNEIALACNIDPKLLGEWHGFSEFVSNFIENKYEIKRPLSNGAERMIEALLKSGPLCFDFLNELFDPESNGFRISIYDEKLRKFEYPNNEIWTKANALLIAESEIKKLGYIY